MSGGPDAIEAAAVLSASAIFGELPHEQRVAIWSRATMHTLRRGETLVRQGTPADAVYVVVSGRFEVTVAGRADVLDRGWSRRAGRRDWIFRGRAADRNRHGHPRFRSCSGSIARPSTRSRATCRRSIRACCARSPGGCRATPCGLRPRSASRLHTPSRSSPAARGIPPAFFDRLASVFQRGGATLFLTQATLTERFPGRALDDPTVSNWLNAMEQEHELIVYLADATLSAWTQKAVRQADQVLIVVAGDAAEALNEVETFALSTHPVSRRRLVRVHARRDGLVSGTGAWLAARDVAMHHHVALEDDADLASLHRFLTGRAIGFVAAGGGGLGSAHLGIHKAFAERGVVFDILGGVSVGAAMMAGFALLADEEEIDRGTEDIFVTSRGFKRRTVPRYALLDHIAFDEALRRHIAAR